jgi:hypothetical protein
MRLALKLFIFSCKHAHKPLTLRPPNRVVARRQLRGIPSPVAATTRFRTACVPRKRFLQRQNTHVPAGSKIKWRNRLYGSELHAVPLGCPPFIVLRTGGDSDEIPASVARRVNDFSKHSSNSSEKTYGTSVPFSAGNCSATLPSLCSL